MTGTPGWLRQLVDAARTVDARELSRYTPPPEGGGRSAAVLILFGEGPAGPDVLIVQRSDGLRSHAGQPAFPGGGEDPGDDGPAGTALREAEEETGLAPSGVDVLAMLPALYLPVSDFVVTPVLAWWREPSAVHAVDAAETAAVARVPIAHLVDPANRLRIRHPTGYVGPAFRAGDMLIWGFTGGLLDRVLELGGWARPWSAAPVEELPPDQLELALRTAPPDHG